MATALRLRSVLLPDLIVLLPQHWRNRLLGQPWGQAVAGGLGWYELGRVLIEVQNSFPSDAGETGVSPVRCIWWSEALLLWLQIGSHLKCPLMLLEEQSQRHLIVLPRGGEAWPGPEAFGRGGCVRPKCDGASWARALGRPRPRHHSGEPHWGRR